MKTLDEYQLEVGELHGRQWDRTPDLHRAIRIKLAEESIELFCAMQSENAAEEFHELGDVLFVVLACARYLGHEASTALDRAIERNRQKWT